MAVVLRRLVNGRIPLMKTGVPNGPVVTNFYTLRVPKYQTSVNLCSHFSKIHVYKSRSVIPALDCRGIDNFSFKNSNNFSNDLWVRSTTRYYCSTKEQEPEKPPSLLQRFKQMYRDYWYVLVPVHLVTSAFWFSSFYYLAKSGVDIAGLLESVGAGETLVEKLRNGKSTMGYLAIAYALYKIATPIRYTVTLGGTTISIKYLKDWGYIKPIPPKEKIKSLITEQKDVILSKKDHLNEMYQKEKEIFTSDKKGFYRRLLPKIVKKPKDEKTQEIKKR